MSIIKVRLRLYMPHDMDLISLMTTHEMDIVKAMYCAITAFVKRDSFAIKIPPLRQTEMKKQHMYHCNLSLDTEKDKEVIELLECIESGYRNNFLKNVLRLYLFCPATEAFFTDSEKMKEMEVYYRTFTEGKRYADAAAIISKKRNIEKRPLEKKTPKEESKIIKKEIQVSQEHIEEPEEEIMEESYEDTTLDDMEDLTDLFTGLLG